MAVLEKLCVTHLDHAPLTALVDIMVGTANSDNPLAQPKVLPMSRLHRENANSVPRAHATGQTCDSAC